MEKPVLKDILRAVRGRGLQFEQSHIDKIQELLDELDHVSIHEEEKSKWVYEVWDKKSPINGVSAQQVIENRHDVDPNTEIYLIKDAQTGQIVFFQPHVPFAEGHMRMDSDSVHEHAKGHINNIAESRAHGRIIDHIINNSGILAYNYLD